MNGTQTNTPTTKVRLAQEVRKLKTALRNLEARLVRRHAHARHGSRSK